jgi:hypothetical protein
LFSLIYDFGRDPHTEFMEFLLSGDTEFHRSQPPP